jgi:hypothetical protein
MNQHPSPLENDICPQELKNVTLDFINDIQTTFPEYKQIIQSFFYPQLESEVEETIWNDFFAFCKLKYIPQFFSIIQQQEEMLETSDTEFLPHIHFKHLFLQDNISLQTKEIMWKYLKLIVVIVISNSNDKSKIFENHLNTNNNETFFHQDFQTKMKETIATLTSMFYHESNINKEKDEEKDEEPKKDEEKEDENDDDENDDENDDNEDEDFMKTFSKSQSKSKNSSFENILPFLEKLFKSKLGKLTTEIAEDVSTTILNDKNISGEKIEEKFGNMMKDPQKLNHLVHQATSKLDDKIKSGEIKESEVISEVQELFDEFQSMPGFNMFGGGGSKVNKKATEEQIKRKLKLAKTKERILAKSELRRKERLAQQQQPPPLSIIPSLCDDELIELFQPKKEEMDMNTNKNKNKNKNKKK